MFEPDEMGVIDEMLAFYTRRGFVEEARIRDFYGPGDHRVTFWKDLTD